MWTSVRDAEEKEVVCAGEVRTTWRRAKGWASDSTAFGPTFSFAKEKKKESRGEEERSSKGRRLYSNDGTPTFRKGNGLKSSKVREERELHASDPCPNKGNQS